jgi:hypothetical protein
MDNSKDDAKGAYWGSVPAIMNSEWLEANLKGKDTLPFTIVGEDTYTTTEGKEVLCLVLESEEFGEIRYKPNDTARKQFQEKGLVRIESLMGWTLDMFVKPVQFGAKMVKGVRIKTLKAPRPTQEKLSKED